MMKNIAMAGGLMIGMVAFAGPADAQVIGTRGTSLAPLGYYSPYPGALYSPFASPPRVYSNFAQPRFVSPFVTPGFGPTIVSPRYYGVTRSYNPGFYAAPSYGYRSHRRW